MHIRFANETDSHDVRDFFLLSLQKTPNAFTTEYYEYQRYTDLYWWNYFSRYITEERNCSKIILAFKDNTLAGSAVLHVETNKRLEHTCNCFWLYVLEEHRGLGLGSAILQKLVKTANEYDLLKIALSVTETQKTAIKLYEKFGFHKIGTKKKEVKINSEFLDMFLYEKILK